MTVKCINNDGVFYNTLIIGELYRIDRESIYIDYEGNAYGEIYTLYEKPIGIARLSRFKSVT